MSKITQEKKEAKLKGKQKKIAKSVAKKAASADAGVEGSSSPSPSKGTILNYGCCCTCAHFPHKANHETQPCKVSGKYVARKAKFECYKCKFG